MRRLICFLATLSLLPAQQPAEPPPTTIRATVDVVLVPTTVLDRSGRHVNGLKPGEFRLYDNGKPQVVTEDVGFLPLSLVVCVQANYDTDTILPKVKKIGPVLRDLMVGQDGEVAILAFDHRIQKLADFTNDIDKINGALDKLRPGSSSSRLKDATLEATRMLRNKKDRRKVILLIAETRDNSSEVSIKEVATTLQLWNIDVYTVNMSTWIAKLTSKPAYPRPDPIPTTARTMPAAGSKDPTTVAQMTAAPGEAMDMYPVFKEIYMGVVGLFTHNPAEAFTRMTGGKEFNFMTQADLERALNTIGDDLHSQYLLSYNPNNKLEGGYHAIKVEVMRPGLKVRTRPGYWMAARPE